MSTLETALGANPRFPWRPAMLKLLSGDWYCSLTEEDLEIWWSHGLPDDVIRIYADADTVDYHMIRDKDETP